MDWYFVLIISLLTIAVCAGIVWFVKLPSSTKIQNVKEWLKYGVTEAEKALGSGTGQLKLRLVYDMAVQKFPWISNLVIFSTFAKWVDEALDWMRDQLTNNSATQDYVNKDN